jgi:hypothetical protein
MRQRANLAFSACLDSIGNDHLHDSVYLSCLLHTHSAQELIDFVFPAAVVNTFVDNFNSTILHSVLGDSRCYISSDSIADDSSNEGVFSDPEFLNSLKEPGIPPHGLRLKIGCICRLTRNFDASHGLTKNTRVIVHNLLRHSVEVETILFVVAGEVVDPASHFPLLGNSS